MKKKLLFGEKGFLEREKEKKKKKKKKKLIDKRANHL